MMSISSQISWSSLALFIGCCALTAGHRADAWSSSSSPLRSLASSAGLSGLGKSSSCSLENYDLTPLAAQPAWVVSQPCINEPSEDCIYYFSLCHALPDTLPISAGNCEGSAVCVDRTAGNLTREWSSLGSFENYGAQALPEYPEFQVIYHVNGSVSNPCRSLLIFRCNESASWSSPPSSTAQPIPSNSLIAVHLFGDCSYIFQFYYNGACKLSGSTHLSIGSYFVVSLTGCVLLYLALGSLIRFARGQRGWKVIPHRQLWNGIGTFVVHGLFFLVSPCQRKSAGTDEDEYTAGTTGSAPKKTVQQVSSSQDGEKTPLLAS